MAVRKGDITKFLWGDLGELPPQLIGRGVDRPHGVGAHVCAWMCSYGMETNDHAAQINLVNGAKPRTVNWC